MLWSKTSQCLTALAKRAGRLDHPLSARPDTDETMASEKKIPSKRAGRPAGQRDFLIYLEADHVKRLKMSAIANGVSSSSIVAKAIENWLANNRSLRGKLGKKRRKKGRQFLATLPVALVKKTTNRALKLETSATNIVATAVGEWLKRKRTP